MTMIAALVSYSDFFYIYKYFLLPLRYKYQIDRFYKIQSSTILLIQLDSIKFYLYIFVIHSYIISFRGQSIERLHHNNIQILILTWRISPIKEFNLFNLLIWEAHSNQPTSRIRLIDLGFVLSTNNKHL